jgi:hypothetical protein
MPSYGISYIYLSLRAESMKGLVSTRVTSQRLSILVFSFTITHPAAFLATTKTNEAHKIAPLSSNLRGNALSALFQPY